MKFKYFFYKTALHEAIINENVDIVKSLLANKNINTNIPYILNIIFCK